MAQQLRELMAQRQKSMKIPYGGVVSGVVDASEWADRPTSVILMFHDGDGGGKEHFA